MEHWDYDKKMECRKWAQEIPYLKFPSEWMVKIIPPFGGASARFMVKLGEKEVSIYLDCYSNLGNIGGDPYWEIYPNIEDDNERFLLGEENLMMVAISLALLKDLPETKAIEGGGLKAIGNDEVEL